MSTRGIKGEMWSLRWPDNELYNGISVHQLEGVVHGHTTFTPMIAECRLVKKIEVIIQPNVADIPVKFYPDCRMKAF